MGAPPCDGCLDDRRCWVCLGHGFIDRPDRSIVTCHRCHGSGRCFICRPAPPGEGGRRHWAFVTAPRTPPGRRRVG